MSDGYIVFVAIVADEDALNAVIPMVDSFEAVQYDLPLARALEVFDDLVFEGKEFA